MKWLLIASIIGNIALAIYAKDKRDNLEATIGWYTWYLKTRSLNVGEVVAACEYVGCDIVDALGNTIETTNNNYEEVYKRIVEHIEAKDGRVLIFTFDNLNKLGMEEEVK